MSDDLLSKFDLKTRFFRAFYEHLKSKTGSISSAKAQIFSTVNFDRIQSIDLLITIAWLCIQVNSTQILVDILSTSKIFPVRLVEDIFHCVLTENYPTTIDQIVVLLTKTAEYRPILQAKRDEILRQMKTNSDSDNLRLLEKSARLFTSIRSNDLEPIVDRLIQSFSHSTISFSSMDSRYLLAMVILNSFQTFDKYSKFFKQIWKLLSKETINVKQVIIAYAKQWNESYSIEDLNVLVNWLDGEYELLNKIFVDIDDQLFKQWIEQIDEEFLLKTMQTLANCTLKKEKHEFLMTKIHSVGTGLAFLINSMKSSILDFNSMWDNNPRIDSRFVDYFSILCRNSNGEKSSTTLANRRQSSPVDSLPSTGSFLRKSFEYLQNPLAVNQTPSRNSMQTRSNRWNHSQKYKIKQKKTQKNKLLISVLFQSIMKQPSENEKILEAARDTTK